MQKMEQEFIRLIDQYKFLFEPLTSAFLYYQDNCNSKFFKEFLNDLLFSILVKLDLEGYLSSADINFLSRIDECQFNNNKYCLMLKFIELKRKYNLIDYPTVSPDDALYIILESLEGEQQLSDKDIKFLKDNHLNTLVETYNLQETNRIKTKLNNAIQLTKKELIFLESNDLTELLEKYHSQELSRKTIPITNKLARNTKLTYQEIDFLATNNLNNLL